MQVIKSTCSRSIPGGNRITAKYIQWINRNEHLRMKQTTSKIIPIPFNKNWYQWSKDKTKQNIFLVDRYRCIYVCALVSQVMQDKGKKWINNTKEKKENMPMGQQDPGNHQSPSRVHLSVFWGLCSLLWVRLARSRLQRMVRHGRCCTWMS